MVAEEAGGRKEKVSKAGVRQKFVWVAEKKFQWESGGGRGREAKGGWSWQRNGFKARRSWIGFQGRDTTTPLARPVDLATTGFQLPAFTATNFSATISLKSNQFHTYLSPTFNLQVQIDSFTHTHQNHSATLHKIGVW
ncbi:hypothetical protein Pcinc_010641 [Petrolisthes cinctipes]|uniref:Uncharacterized protein n=1 Tax=Petrolisthes cinctipes TaxID=88211 RepID=A0AAE1G2U9_PETCI|nr:hypothetical protein Pcinc_010641 [Petrolisthes cinctipes]